MFGYVWTDCVLHNCSTNTALWVAEVKGIRVATKITPKKSARAIELRLAKFTL